MIRDGDRTGGHIGDGRQRLVAHVEECAACGRNALPIDGIAMVLSRSALSFDPRQLSAQVIERVRPQMERLAARAFRRRVAVVLVISMLPLPLVLAYDAYLLRFLYGAVSWLLPEAVAAYLVLSYAAALVLLLAATYAAIPILLAPPIGPPLATQE